MNKAIRKAFRLGACSLVLANSACAQEIAPAANEVDTPLERMSDNSDATTVSLDDQVSIAVSDLADRAGVAADAVVVVQARTVNWGSSALGCPKKDMNYTQAIVPGVLLLLEADGRIYRYHGRQGTRPFYCPDERAEAPAYGQGEEFM